MTAHAWILFCLFLTTLFLLVKPTGTYLAQVMQGEHNVVTRIGAPLENMIYRVCRVNRDEEMTWQHYTFAILLFNVLGTLATYGLQRLQNALPLNPQGLPAVAVDSSFNTAISFATNTNWQAYAGESTMSYFTQMAGLTVQNFLSAATGIVVLIALVRGFAAHASKSLGNAWVDLTRCSIYILAPLSLALAVFFVSQGAIQNFQPYQLATPLETLSAASSAPTHPTPSPLPRQVLPMGPVASQEAIKLLGTNGGGFFNANSAHPFENPTPLSNFMQMLAIFLLPAALCYSFGCIVGDTRQGWALLMAMALLFTVLSVASIHFEQQGNPLLNAAGADQTASIQQAGGNMEGKETRFGIADSSLFAAITTSASSGAVISMHDSFTPLGGLIPLVLMQLGEVVFGGAGSGLYGMLVFAITAVFIAGLMIGRTPEYLGKKIGAFEIKMVTLAILVTPVLVLGGTATALMLDAGRAGVANPGAHGFSEVLYAYTSAANNNGSAFAGLSANTPFYNISLAIAMWFGRFGVIVPVLALSGALAAKKRLPVTAGTLPTHGPLFVLLLVGTILLVGLLNYVPALALGPVIEQLQLVRAS